MFKRILNLVGINKVKPTKESIIDSSFDKNKILEDYEFNYRVCPLGHLSKINLPLEKVIDICQKYNVDYRIILTLMEVQSDIISYALHKEPPRERLDYVLGIGKNLQVMEIFSKKVDYFKGFEKQIMHACALLRKHFDMGSIKVNKQLINIIDGSATPVNKATYALYMLVPYIGLFDLYKQRVNKDNDNNAIQEEVIIPHHNKILAFFGKTEKMIKCDIEKILIHKAPFGMYKFYLLWKGWWK